MEKAQGLDNAARPLGSSSFLEASFTDSASVISDKPLFEKVRERLPAWQAINTSPFILDWIHNGVHMPMTDTPFNFHHKNAELPAEELAYWHDKLEPHYLASGAIIKIDRPTW